MDYTELFQLELMDINNHYKNKEEMLCSVSQVLKKKNFINQGFYEALIDREKSFPTGLELAHINIAIPHTDVEFVKEPFIYFVKLADEIDFYQMGSDDQQVTVSVVMVLGIKNPKEQVGLLSKLMELFSDKNFVRQVVKTEDKENILGLVRKNF